jgi:hypothetical protein
VTRNKPYDAWTWGAASLAAHLVLAVELGALGVGFPRKGEPEAPEPGPVSSETWTLRPPAPRFDTTPLFPNPRGIGIASPGDELSEIQLIICWEEPDPGVPKPVSAEPSSNVESRQAGSIPTGIRPVHPRPQGNPDGSDPLQFALRWLARHQSPDGLWRVREYTKQCRKICAPNPGHDDFDTGVTGLAILAFLAAGHTHRSGEVRDGIRFGDVVSRGLQALLRAQDAQGCIGPRAAQKHMYNHLVATRALCDAYRFTRSTLVLAGAQGAVDFTVSAQNPGKGWRYSFRCGDNDSSLTGWAVLALESAGRAGLAVPRSALDGARAWFDEATNRASGIAGYTHKDAKWRIAAPSLGPEFDSHETMTALGMIARLAIDRNRTDPLVRAGADALLKDRPRFEGERSDFYYWHFASRALSMLHGPEAPEWKEWRADALKALRSGQTSSTGSCREGSWEPEGPWRFESDAWSGEGGRVYATAINAWTLALLQGGPHVR